MPTYQQLPSGSWRVQVRKSGLYRAGTFTTKREARDWATGIESQAKHLAAGGAAPIAPGFTVEDLIDQYRKEFATKQGRTKANTLNMLVRELGKIKLAKLNAVHLADFVNRRREAGAGGVTISADLSFLSAVLNWARFAKQWDVDPQLAKNTRAALTHTGLQTRSSERNREPTNEELEKLYEYWRANPWTQLPMEKLVRFALATGMRQAEICNIRVEDVDRAAKTVIIRDRKDPKRKIGNNQTVPLLPDAWAIVEPLIADRTEGRIFPYVSKSLSASFTRITAKLGIEDLHFHDLRHKAAADFFRAGLDIPRVALMTGHKSWAMLRRYTDIKADDVHQAFKPREAQK